MDNIPKNRAIAQRNTSVNMKMISTAKTSYSREKDFLGSFRKVVVSVRNLRLSGGEM